MIDNDFIPIMMSLRDASQRTGLSYNCLRELCAQNKIVYLRSGKKIFVNYRKLIDFLDKGETEE